MAGRKEFPKGYAMPTDLDSLSEGNAQLLSPSDQRHARDELELVSLRATVVRLLEEIGVGSGPAPAQRLPDPADVATLPQAEFLSMLAHELRNPLQSMAMANQLLSGTAQVSAAAVQAHAVLDRQIGHMSRMLDDLLDASRAASGKIVLKIAPVRLRDVINSALETSHPYVHSRQQQLRVDLPEDVTVSGDLIRLGQVFSNLVINASQFSDTGGRIAIAAACHGDLVEITVSDDGAGIPAELQPYIFDMFTQGHRTLERAPGGLGIGLSLVRTIVRLHGGTSAVTSAGDGAGSSFRITLPIAPMPPAAVPAQTKGGAARRKILIIEDNVDANELMAMLLEMAGHEVTSSFDGVDGLRVALAGQFDIVLCDLGLPGLTGLEVVAALKAARPDDAPFAVATTGYSDGPQRDLARAAGFDHYLVKPLDMPALHRVLAEYAA
ncbi:hybrid sensor histidine kinase/response regulator [Massilia eurypsychrophila]|uniref:histidine kinase n=1 Tax=Massilia eurypsychrophila TaxID=1485217 RepID=A0A2G8TI85_9BURK|nr:hybrid sensor histidine kinase/response regulator [Massilia eurypsychrophila]PIL45669.1 hybrid sensor histidine kinase/response regulator [Massilia eurypsychrophila]